MFKPDDPFSPPGAVFDEAWQAQVLAMAEAMVTAGHFSANEWAEALGHELAEAEAKGAPDTLETYYQAALVALETLSASIGITDADQTDRKAQWERAYLNTPHGAPVLLDAGKP